MLPPVVSSGQYQIMESRIAMVEHIAMTDKAMTGPQWHNLRTSWRFSNVTKVDRKFILSPQVASILAVQFLKWLNELQCVTFFLCYLAKSAAETARISFLVFWLPSNWPGPRSLGLSVSHSSLYRQRAASSPANLQDTLTLWQTQIPHLWDKKGGNFKTS